MKRGKINRSSDNVIKKKIYFLLLHDLKIKKIFDFPEYI